MQVTQVVALIAAVHTNAQPLTGYGDGYHHDLADAGATTYHETPVYDDQPANEIGDQNVGASTEQGYDGPYATFWQ